MIEGEFDEAECNGEISVDHSHSSSGGDNDDDESESDSVMDEIIECTGMEEEAKQDVIPVTILSGFLGAGKTTLLRHILQSKEHELKVAVIVNDMAEINIDGDLVRQVKKEVITLENGCICCTLRGDLIREISRIQSMGGFDYVLIESTGIAEPQQVAESFCADPHTSALAENEGEMLWNLARLDTCVTVIDACDFPHHLASLHRFKDKFRDGLDDTIGGEEGEKSISQLVIEQVEFANVIILNKTDLVSKDALISTTQLIKTLNPKAAILTTEFGVVEPSKILNTKLFSMEEAEKSPGWLISLGPNGSMVPSTSESDEYGVSSFVFRARKPFHPTRLSAWINELFVWTNDWLNDKKSVTAANDKSKLEKMKGRYGLILRSKGFCWIAGRDTHTAGWAHSGRLFSMDAMIPWYATMPEDEWDTEGDEDLAVIKSKFEGEYGDRRQEIVFIGTGLFEYEIRSALNSCLLTDDEMQRHDDRSNMYLDPLSPWTFHYAEPSVLTQIIRPGQVHKFFVEDDVQVTLSNVALNIIEDDRLYSNGAVKVKVQVWLDLCTESNQVTGSSLLCTLRSCAYEQHSMSLVLPGTMSENHNGPMMFRAECNCVYPTDPSKVEVHLTGSVSYLSAFSNHYEDNEEEEENNDDDDDESEGDHRHNQGNHNHGAHSHRRPIHKRLKTAGKPVPEAE